MKKRILIFVLVVCTLFVTACSSGYGKYDNKISELRSYVYEGACENFTVTAVSGEREQPFEIDGQASKRVDFAVITVKPKVFDISASYDYKITYDGNEYEGQLVRHPFNETYSVEIGVKITDDFVVSINGDECEISMTSVKKDGFISANKAFDIALERLNNTVKQLENYEIYIRFTKNPVNEEDGYFWYVAFVDGENTYAVLINPETAEIVACKEKE